MDNHNVIRTVSALYSELSAGMLLYLGDIAAFVSDADVSIAASITEMAHEEKGCLQRLAELLDSLDATPGPPKVHADVAALPYNKVNILIPRLIKNKQHLLDRCKQAGQWVAGHAAATECISLVTNRHKEHLEKLSGLSQPQAT